MNKENLCRKSKKRLFIGLLLGSWFTFLVLLLGLWILIKPGLTQICELLPPIIGVVLIIICITITMGIFLIILTLILEKEIIFSQRIRRIIIKYLFPLTLVFGKSLKIKKEAIQHSFIEVNNKLVMIKELNVTSNDVIILLPQCLQNYDCPIRVTSNIRNCKRCGKCKLGEIVELGKRWNVEIFVATGGTLARKIIVEQRPKAIIAVACERDLISGIQDSYPLPVIGIFNTRPQGPCINTNVDVTQIEEALISLLKTEKIKNE